MNQLVAIVLAAGKSTRMKSNLSKVLHPVAGLPLVIHPLKALKELKVHRTVLVIADGKKNEFESILGDSFKVEYVVQKEALGTGHAVMVTDKALKGQRGYALILAGDVPLIKSESLKSLFERVQASGAVCGLITTTLEDAGHYGRIVRDTKGDVIGIVEAKDADGEELLIDEINTGIFCVELPWLFEAIKSLKPQNKQKEYYLTDIVKYAVDKGAKVIGHCIRDDREFLGVNTRAELAEVNQIMRKRINDRLMIEGVSIVDPSNTYIDSEVRIGRDTTIYPNTFIKGKTTIGQNCTIENGVVIKDAVIASDVLIKPYSVIEDSEVRAKVQMGPFSRLRPGAVLDEGARVGNFVEIKKSFIGKGSKANHLTYIGDAEIGRGVNVGCGTITCNYDGVKKHKTIIGDDVFVGSDVQFVAPVKIGKGAVIAAGSTVTDDVPPKALAIARARQTNKKGWKK